MLLSREDSGDVLVSVEDEKGEASIRGKFFRS